MDEIAEPKKPFLHRYWWLLVIIAIILVVVAVSVIKSIGVKNSGPNKGPSQEGFIPQASDQKSDQETQWPSLEAKYITALPLDLTQIMSISKFRSCAGHDFSGYSFEKILETNRSMKHYIYPISAYQGTINKVAMFAPFDGTVSDIYFEADNAGKPGKRPQSGNGITFSTPVDENAFFEFDHVYFVKDFKIGDKVSAGELVGYAALGDKGNDFDIVLSGQRNSPNRIFGSVFDHMTDSVLAEFAKYEVTAENTKVTREYRDAKPCNYDSPSQSGRTGDDWLQLVL